MPLRNHQRFVKRQHEPGRPVLVLKGSEASVLTSAGKHLINVLNTFFHPRASKIRDVIGIQSLRRVSNILPTSRECHERLLSASTCRVMASRAPLRCIYLSQLIWDESRHERVQQSSYKQKEKGDVTRAADGERSSNVRRQNGSCFFFFPRSELQHERTSLISCSVMLSK